MRLSVPNGAYAVTVGAGGGTTMIVAAPVRVGSPGCVINGLSKGFKTGAGNVGTGGTKENGVKERNGLTGAKNGLKGAKNGLKEGTWAEQLKGKLIINANETNPNKMNVKIFTVFMLILLHGFIIPLHISIKHKR